MSRGARTALPSEGANLRIGTPLHALMRRIVFAVRDERNSTMIHNRAPLARSLLMEGESY